MKPSDAMLVQKNILHPLHLFASRESQAPSRDSYFSKLSREMALISTAVVAVARSRPAARVHLANVFETKRAAKLCSMDLC